ncbi:MULTISPECIES: GTPase domain-containing protein [unclassified Actinobaculum]|uniref:GTPase n=1 Tax=unclassified Actinobaculum TaxID=2609299 RepID=UPI0013DE434B|nr:MULTISPECIES: GTPase domain-containing protein [unclassified Actinobaculum]
MKSATTHRDLVDLVARTISALENARLPLDMPGSRELSESRQQLLTQLKTRILPHLRQADLPAVVVLGGSSGAGKSTIFNSILGEEASPASVLRPTTRFPAIAVHPSNAAAMEDHALLEMGKVVVSEGAVPGIVLVDAPDLDSVDAGNRELSRRLLDAADLWVFVTTAARYGDALAWDTLADAHRRGMTTAVVLNRIPERALEAVRSDLLSRMEATGIGEDPLMLINDAGPHEGLLEPEDVAVFREWLEVIAAAKLGTALVDRTTQAMLPELRRELLDLSEAVELQAAAVQDLAEKARQAAEEPRSRVASNARLGRYGHGAPTTSWLSFASTGGALASLAAGERPGLLQRRRKVERDAAAGSVFDGVLTSIRVGLNQALISADEAIQKVWGETVVQTVEYREEGHKRLSVRGIVADAVSQWHSDLTVMAQTVPDNPWLTPSGVAALLGSAAGGVGGAEQALRVLGVAEVLRPAREKLAERLEGAVDQAAAAYTSVLDEIPIGNGRQLRLRASEYLAQNQAKGA